MKQFRIVFEHKNEIIKSVWIDLGNKTIQYFLEQEKAMNEDFENWFIEYRG